MLMGKLVLVPLLQRQELVILPIWEDLLAMPLVVCVRLPQAHRRHQVEEGEEESSSPAHEGQRFNM